MSIAISDSCTSCGKCIKKCPAGAIFWSGNAAAVDNGKCTDCGKCIEKCPAGAISMSGSEMSAAAVEKMYEYKREHIGKGKHHSYKKGSFLARLTHRLHI